jgi:NAD(P)-dependent dehydrogenase (short-subunit alcohol dehydrogenase family)
MERTLDGRVAWVTGATGALGRAVVAELAGRGARVVAAYRDAARLADLRGHADAVRVDLGRRGSVDAAAEAIAARHGGLDVLVACAGGYSEAPLAATGDEDWAWNLEVNLTGAFRAIRAAWPHLQRSGRGRVVTVATRPALRGEAGLAAYASSTGALLRLTEVAAAEGLAGGVTANAVLPGIIDTPANRRDMPDADFSRWVAPEAIARVIAWLCSDDAAVVSGAAVPVYGRS